jgi:Tfp pilus assembly protein PilO
MNLVIKLLPIILITVVFYVLIYDLYPKYQGVMDLIKKLNEFHNKEVELDTLQKLIQSISQNPNVQQLINNKDVLDIWLPQEPKIEEVYGSLVGIYQLINLPFKEAEIKISPDPKFFNDNVLPVKVINISLSANLNNNNLISFIDGIERNARLMVIKKANISSEDVSKFEVESYYLHSE